MKAGTEWRPEPRYNFPPDVTLPDFRWRVTSKAHECALPRAIAIVDTEEHAKLIAAAINACALVNPDNPMAVAEAIWDMYTALDSIVAGINRECFGIREYEEFKFHRDSPLANTLKNALAKAKRKEAK